MTADAKRAPRPSGQRHLGQTLKHAVVYGLGTVLSRLVGFLMIPIYTRLLTPEDYGVLELLAMTTNVLGMLAGVGLTTAVTRYYYVYQSKEDRRAVVSSAAILQVVLFGVATGLALPLAGQISLLILGDDQFVAFVRLALIGFFLSSWIELPLVILRAQQRSAPVVALGVVRLVLALSLNILFVVVLRQGVAGVLYSTIIASGVMGLFLMGGLVHRIGLRFDRAIAARLLRYGAPLIAASVGTFILHFSDRFLLRAYASLDEVGLYSLGYRFAMLLSVFIATPFSMIWTPKALELHQSQGPAAKPVLRRILSWYLVVLGLAGLVMALFTTDALRLVAGPNFQGADRAVPLLCLALVFYGYRQVSRLGAWLTEHSGLIASSTVVAVVVVLAANLLLIPRFGAMGAAAATVLAFATEFAVLMGRVRTVYSLEYPVTRLLGPLIIGTVTYAFAVRVIPEDASLAVSLAGKAAAVAAAAVLMILARPSDTPRTARSTPHPVPLSEAERGGPA